MKFITVVNNKRVNPISMPCLSKVRRRRLVYEVAYRMISRHGLTVFRVPKGFKWDGASIPRLVWSLVGSPFSPILERGALLHDYLYYSGRTSRLNADRILKAMWRHDGVGKIRARIMYRAVRLGGIIAWKKHRRNNGSSK